MTNEVQLLSLLPHKSHDVYATPSPNLSPAKHISGLCKLWLKRVSAQHCWVYKLCAKGNMGIFLIGRTNWPGRTRIVSSLYWRNVRSIDLATKADTFNPVHNKSVAVFLNEFLMKTLDMMHSCYYTVIKSIILCMFWYCQVKYCMFQHQYENDHGLGHTDFQSLWPYCIICLAWLAAQKSMNGPHNKN